MDERTDLPDPVPGQPAGETGGGSVPAGSDAPEATGERPQGVTGEAPEAAAERAYPSTVGGLAYLAMLVVACVALVVVVVSDWRVGMRVFAGALVGGALLRVALPAREAGMLAVRGKVVDSVLLLAVGGALLVLASSIPDQPV